MNDSIITVADSLQVSQSSSAANSVSYTWVWLVISVLIVLSLVILWTRLKLQNYRNIRQQVMQDGSVDFSSTMNDIFMAKQIYDQLKVTYHPDRFIDPEKNKIANQLYQEITKNQHNYRCLCNLQKECEDKLGK